MQTLQWYSQMNRQLEPMDPKSILQWAVNTYGNQLSLLTSFQPSGLVILHMLLDIMPDISILTLDTGLLFPETYNLIEKWEHQFNLQVIRVRPRQTLEQQSESYETALWERNADLCCNLRKTVPLADALKHYLAWITGIRRDQSENRRTSPVISWEAKYNNIKLAPLATWTEEMVWTYIHAHELPYNPLHDQNYPSIGCYPCTRAVAPGEDKRAGRWSGQAKTECGIHLSTFITNSKETNP